MSNSVYYKELQRDYMSKHAPGPGTYNSKSFFTEVKQGGKINPAPKIKFTKSKKKTYLLNSSKHSQSLSLNNQILQDHDQFIKLKTKQGKMCFGTAPRIYDPIFYSAQNREFVIKGLR